MQFHAPMPGPSGWGPLLERLLQHYGRKVAGQIPHPLGLPEALEAPEPGLMGVGLGGGEPKRKPKR